ncbi:hypothetical protein AAMO2058_000539700 [Amorphochlora amoebiformis]
MCLFPGGAALHTTDPTCRFWRSVMIGGLFFHAMLIVLGFISLSFWDAIMDILAITIAYCAIKDEDQYEVSRLLCYVMFMIFDFVFAGVKCCLFFSGVRGAPSGENKNWQYYMYVVLVVGSSIYYLIGGFISYRLYKALKRVFQPEEGAPIAAPPAAPSGGYGGYQPVASEYNEAEIGSSGGGFKRFQGEGRRLGGSSGQRRLPTEQPRSSPAQVSAAPPTTSAAPATANVSRGQRRGIPAAALARLEQKSKGNKGPE